MEDWYFLISISASFIIHWLHQVKKSSVSNQILKRCYDGAQIKLQENMVYNIHQLRNVAQMAT